VSLYSLNPSEFQATDLQMQRDREREESRREYCQHDYAHPVRKGRAHYVCRKCGVDITLALVMLYEECFTKSKKKNKVKQDKEMTMRNVKIIFSEEEKISIAKELTDRALNYISMAGETMALKMIDELQEHIRNGLIDYSSDLTFDFKIIICFGDLIEIVGGLRRQTHTGAPPCVAESSPVKK
jgi:hypothetical protein